MISWETNFRTCFYIFWVIKNPPFCCDQWLLSFIWKAMSCLDKKQMYKRRAKNNVILCYLLQNQRQILILYSQLVVTWWVLWMIIWREKASHQLTPSTIWSRHLSPRLSQLQNMSPGKKREIAKQIIMSFLRKKLVN